LQEFSFNAAKLKKYLIIRALKSVFFSLKKDGRFGRARRFGRNRGVVGYFSGF